MNLSKRDRAWHGVISDVALYPRALYPSSRLLYLCLRTPGPSSAWRYNRCGVISEGVITGFDCIIYRPSTYSTAAGRRQHDNSHCPVVLSPLFARPSSRRLHSAGSSTGNNSGGFAAASPTATATAPVSSSGCGWLWRRRSQAEEEGEDDHRRRQLLAGEAAAQGGGGGPAGSAAHSRRGRSRRHPTAAAAAAVSSATVGCSTTGSIDPFFKYFLILSIYCCFYIFLLNLLILQSKI
jgi:hypothetical protein